MNEHQLFYVGQKAFIEKDGKILVLTDPDEGLDFPGGRIEQGENDLSQSLRREVREETGLEINVGDPFVSWYNTFPEGHPLEGKRVFLVGYKCNYVSGEVALSDEHDGFKWVDEKDYRQVDDKTKFFKILEKYFHHHA